MLQVRDSLQRNPGHHVFSIYIVFIFNGSYTTKQKTHEKPGIIINYLGVCIIIGISVLRKGESNQTTVCLNLARCLRAFVPSFDRPFVRSFDRLFAGDQDRPVCGGGVNVRGR